MNVRLVLERKHKRIWTTQLRHPESTLGRAHECNIRVPSSEVSRLHCRLRIENGVVLVEDLGSVNGTFLNGQRIEDQEVVHPGDHLSLGSAVTFVVEYELTAEALRRLSDEVEDVLETVDDSNVLVEDEPEPAVLEPIEDESSQPTVDVLPLVEPVEEVSSQPTVDYIPLEEPIEEVRETGAEVSLLGGREVHLPEGGDLRDFLLELDDTDERPKKPKR